MAERPKPTKRHSSGGMLQLGRSPGGAMKHAVGGGKSKLGARVPSSKNINKMGRAAAGQRVTMPRNTSKTHLRKNQSETALLRAERAALEAETEDKEPSTPPDVPKITLRQTESSLSKTLPQSLPRKVDSRPVIQQLEQDHYYGPNDVSEDEEATETESKRRADIKKGKQPAEDADQSDEDVEEGASTTQLPPSSKSAAPHLLESRVLSMEELQDGFEAQKHHDEQIKLKAAKATPQKVVFQASPTLAREATTTQKPISAPSATSKPISKSILPIRTTLPSRPSGTFNVQANLERDRLLQMQPVHPLPPSAWKSTNMLQAAHHANDLDSEYSKKLGKRMDREIVAKLDSRMACTGRSPFLESLMRLQAEGGLGRSRRMDLAGVRGNRTTAGEGEEGEDEEGMTEEEALEEMVAGDLEELEEEGEWEGGGGESESESE